VSTLDLVRIQRHILGLEKFTTPKQFIAADVNNDQRINVSDLVELRKVILGLQDGFRNNNSWLFFDERDILSKVSWPLNDFIQIDAGADYIDDLHFFGLKIGDVD
jgi:hypothetical protein